MENYTIDSDENAFSVVIPAENRSSEDNMNDNPYILPMWLQAIYISLFGGMVLVATGGNLIVIWIVLANKGMRTVTNYFIVNLSLADTMVSTLNVIFNFISMLNGNWPFGTAYCKVSNFIAIVSVAASVFTLMAICIDRYMAIMRPLRPRMSRTTTLNITIWIWIASSLLSLPNILYSTTEVELYANGNKRTNCFLKWPDGDVAESPSDYVYNVIILVVTYVIPVTAMAFTYSRVGRELWGSQSIGECTSKQLDAIKSKRKIVKMMIVVVVIFAVCWLPYHLYFLISNQYPDITHYDNIQHIYLAIYWLAMSNSMYNPLIYCWMNSRFREGFRKVFCCQCVSETSSAKQPQHMVTRYSCSEPYADTRVTFNGSANIPLHTLTETLSTAHNISLPNIHAKFLNKNSEPSQV